MLTFECKAVAAVSCRAYVMHGTHQPYMAATSLRHSATQAPSQVSGESGGNTTLPSWNHLTQIAQVRLHH
jgi:hypothetical protein